MDRNFSIKFFFLKDIKLMTLLRFTQKKYTYRHVQTPVVYFFEGIFGKFVAVLVGNTLSRFWTNSNFGGSNTLGGSISGVSKMRERWGYWVREESKRW